MIAKNNLFLLIKSMTGHEKRYFKLFSSLYERDKHYLKLFNAIDKQRGEYNEARIVNDLKQESWLSHLSKIKNQLYNNILKSLEIYAIDSSMVSQLQRATILFGRGLYSQSKKLINKLKPYFEKQQNYILLVEVLLLERKISSHLYFEGKTQEDIVAMNMRINYVMKLIQNENDYQAIADRIHFLVNKYSYVRTSVQLKEAQSIFSSPLLKDIRNVYSDKALLSYYFSHVFYYGFIGDYENACKYSIKQMELMRKQENYFANNFTAYLSSLTNYLQSAILSRKFGYPFQKYLSELEEFYLDPSKLNPAADIRLKTRLFVRLYMIRFLLYTETGQFDKITTLLRGYRKSLETYKPLLIASTITDLSYFIAVHHFGIRKYTRAYGDLESILASEQITEELYGAAKLLQLFVAFEMQDDRLLEHNARSTYGYLKKRNLFLKFEQVLIRFIGKSIRHFSDKSIMKTLFIQLKKDFEKIKADPFEKRAFEYFDYISWVESKIESRLFADVVKEKIKIKAYSD